jgi:putative NADH-flavin reductase
VAINQNRKAKIRKFNFKISAMKNNNTLPAKKIVVLGANGGIGKQTVELALQYGYTVTAILRNPDKLQIKHKDLLLAKGDVMNPETLEKHFENADAIISAIGKTSFKATDLYSLGNKNILNSMNKVGATRIFFISASGLAVNPTHSAVVRFATKYILQKLLKNMYEDLERMEKLVKDSQIDWTIMRPPRLIDKQATGHYRFSINSIVKNGLTISRADLAHYMLNNIRNETIYRTTVEIAY